MTKFLILTALRLIKKELGINILYSDETEAFKEAILSKLPTTKNVYDKHDQRLLLESECETPNCYFIREYSNKVSIIIANPEVDLNEAWLKESKKLSFPLLCALEDPDVLKTIGIIKEDETLNSVNTNNEMKTRKRRKPEK